MGGGHAGDNSVTIIFLIQQRLDLIGRRLGLATACVENNFPFAVLVRSPDGIERAPVFGFVAFLIFANYAKRSA